MNPKINAKYVKLILISRISDEIKLSGASAIMILHPCVIKH